MFKSIRKWRSSQLLGQVLGDLYRHRFTYILRSSLLHLVIAVGGVYALSMLLRMVLVSSNLPGLTIDNLRSFLVDPIAVVLLVVYLLAVALLLFAEFSAMVHILQIGESSLRSSYRRFLGDIWRFFKSLLGWHFLAFVAYLILLIPILQFILPSALLQNIYIPTFIADNLLNTTPGKWLYYGAYALVWYLNLRLVFTLPLSALQPQRGFGQHMADSWRRTKGRQIFSILTAILLMLGLMALISGVIFGIFVLFLALLGQSLNTFFDLLSTSFFWGILFALNLLNTLAFMALLLGYLQPERPAEGDVAAAKWHKWGLLGLILVIGAVTFGNQLLENSGSRNQNQVIIAHRGYVEKGVENSIPALEAAAQAGADYSELDVILSKDGQFIVSHDDNLQRLTGQDITISQSNAADVIGLKTRQNGHEAEIVSLVTFIQKAKELGIKLVIELKPPQGFDQERYAQAIVSLMQAQGVTSDYLVMSLNLPLIERVEALDSSLTTGYTISFQLGDFTTQKVDFYAIEDFSYRSSLARRAHRSGKKVYVWTINQSDVMEDYFQGQSDGIITDYPKLASQERQDVINDKD